MIFALGLLACSGGGPTGPLPSATLVYTGNVDGEIEPCG